MISRRSLVKVLHFQRSRQMKTDDNVLYKLGSGLFSSYLKRRHFEPWLVEEKSIKFLYLVFFVLCFTLILYV
eukprot:c19461_g1_i1 orf=208-423(+)